MENLKRSSPSQEQLFVDKDKENILQNSKKLKNAGFHTYKDFCKVTMELWKSFWEEVLGDRQQNKIAYINYRPVVVRDRR